MSFLLSNYLLNIVSTAPKLSPNLRIAFKNFCKIVLFLKSGFWIQKKNIIIITAFVYYFLKMSKIQTNRKKAHFDFFMKFSAFFKLLF